MVNKVVSARVFPVLLGPGQRRIQGGRIQGFSPPPNDVDNRRKGKEEEKASRDVQVVPI